MRVVVVALAGCTSRLEPRGAVEAPGFERRRAREAPGLEGRAAVEVSGLEGREAIGPDPRRVALLPAEGDDRVARKIREIQRRLRASQADPRLWEELGWAFVERARATDDPGFYTLATYAADALLARSPKDPGALLLRGHALHAQHRFREAEAIARDLTERRGLPADHGLLGDALLDRGDLEGAHRAYQRMMDLKPDAQAFARAAQILWLRGHSDAALEAMAVAARATSRRHAEAFAWTHAELALHLLRRGRVGDAKSVVDPALRAAPDSARALRVAGQVELARGQIAAAEDLLRRSAERAPLSETLWLRADALHRLGRVDEARAVEARLEARGGQTDPRGLSLFLATRRRGLPRAIALARDERTERGDPLTLDALAWSQYGAGQLEAASRTIRDAARPGVEDPRLHLHAALIARARGDEAAAQRSLHLAKEGAPALFPSERDLLQAAL